MRKQIGKRFRAHGTEFPGSKNRMCSSVYSIDVLKFLQLLCFTTFSRVYARVQKFVYSIVRKFNGNFIL